MKLEKNTGSDRLTEELLKIAEIGGITTADGVKARKQALLDWMSRWIIEVSSEQRILDKRFSQEEEDYIAYHLSKLISEPLLESCASIIREKNRIEVKMWALRREE